MFLKRIRKILKVPLEVLTGLDILMRGSINTIELTDDEGKRLGIKITKRKDRVVVSGEGILPRVKFKDKKAVCWADDLLHHVAKEKAAKGTKVRVARLQYLSLRNATRLAFAVRQIVLDGPTYFCQEATFLLGGKGPLMTMMDIADYAVPDVELRPEASQVGADDTNTA